MSVDMVVADCYTRAKMRYIENYGQEGQSSGWTEGSVWRLYPDPF